MTDGNIDRTRRDVLKYVGGAAGGGALGSLAGCTGGGDGGGGADGSDGGGGNGGSDGSGGSGDGAADGGGGSGPIEINFLSAAAVENTQTKTAFDQSMKTFEEEQGNVVVNLQTASYGDIRNKLASSVESGNPPTFAESGSLSLQFWSSGDIPDHDPFIEGEEGLLEDWTGLNKQVAEFRGTFFNAGAPSGSGRGLAIRPKLVSQVGVTDPLEEMATWSQTLDVINRLQEEFPDIIPWEETGVGPDLESYWGEARTAYTDGDDPWIRGDPTAPDVLVNEEPATDGMIINCVKLAQEYSSDESANRPDEEMASLMLTDRAAMVPHGFQGWTPFTNVKEDAVIGWAEGEGDVMLIPLPKVNPEYGADIGIPEIEGIQGEHGGHVSALEASHAIFKNDDQAKMDASWELNMWVQRSPDHVLPIYGEADPGLPQSQSVIELFQEELDPPQMYTEALRMIKEYGPQYTATGAAWDVFGTSQIRWTDINETISEGIAGQHDIQELPSIIRQRIDKTLQEQNS